MYKLIGGDSNTTIIIIVGGCFLLVLIIIGLYLMYPNIFIADTTTTNATTTTVAANTAAAAADTAAATGGATAGGAAAADANPIATTTTTTMTTTMTTMGSKLTNQVSRSQINNVKLSENNASSPNQMCNYENDLRYCINEKNYGSYHNILWNDDHSFTIDFSKIQERQPFVTYFYNSSNYSGSIRFVFPNKIENENIDSNQNTQSCYKITISPDYNKSIQKIDINNIN